MEGLKVLVFTIIATWFFVKPIWTIDC